MTDLNDESLKCERRGSVAVITLNRPTSINAVNMSIRNGLATLLPELNDDASVSAVVIHGAGERGFCAGADIKEPRPPVTAVGERDRLTPTSWIETIDQVRKPVIAAIHGICMGAGLEMALACDIRVAAKGSRFALPETKLGLIPGGGGTQRLARVIGVGRAMDMILSAEEMDAETALASGLISRLFDTPEEVLEQAVELAEKLGQRPQIAMAYAKEAVNAGIDLPLKAGLTLEKSLFAIVAEAAAKARAEKAQKKSD
jgi:enoyl-CoA hydratase/carnithine racemase